MMDTEKLNDVIDAAVKVQAAASELLNDAESVGKLAVFVEELDDAAALFDELAEELIPTEEEETEEEEPETEEEEGDKQNETLREWAGLPPEE